jgi:hypothetical protein
MHKVFSRIIISFFILNLSLSLVHADFYSEAEKIKAFNPDGQKYEFIRDYLTSLSYIYANIKKYKDIDLNANLGSERNKGAKLLAGLVQDNANLRVAKNYLDKYLKSSNGLIMKTADMYIGICDQLIELNQKELELYSALFDAQNGNKMDIFDEEAFRTRRDSLFNERSLSLKGLVETSYYAQKIMVSSRLDRFGELVNLGITKSQRDRLISRIDELFPHLEDKTEMINVPVIDASVWVVKERLIDETWGTIK